MDIFGKFNELKGRNRCCKGFFKIGKFINDVFFS